MSILALQLLFFIVTLLLTGCYRTLALKYAVLDRPVERSNHSSPIPVGGGLTIAIVFLAASTHYYFTGSLTQNQFLAILSAGFIALIGFADDCFRLDIRWRIPGQIAASLWVVFCLGDLPAVNFLIFELNSQWLLKLCAILSLLWLLNLYNFMDGIDGLAAGELLFVSVMSLLLVINVQDGVTALLSATLFTAAAGFLVWNWPPARIFMGDAGSSFIGFSLGVLALISIQQGSLNLWTWVILLGVFVTDATVTLLRRVLNGDAWHQGHSTHAYQHAVRKYKSHGKVTITVVVLNFAWLAPMAWLSVLQPRFGLLWCLLALTPLLLIALRLGAGKQSGSKDGDDRSESDAATA